MWLILTGWMVSVVGAGPPSLALESTAYDQRSGQWLLDFESVVSRNDVLYTHPSRELWEAMPVGGGDLSAMVYCSGATLDLHLTKSDCWGFQLPPEAALGGRFFNNVSPGHVRLVLGPRAQSLAEKRFRQRLDLYRGRIVIELGPPQSTVTLIVWGHPHHSVLTVEVLDAAHALGPIDLELTQWRPSMKVQATSQTLEAVEVHRRPARPHLANTGMQDYFQAGHDPLEGRGTALCVAVRGASVQDTVVTPDGLSARTRVGPDRAEQFQVILAAAVTPQGDPLPVARHELATALATPDQQWRSEHTQWWQEWWNKSFLRIESPDRLANWLCAAYHVQLYSLACVNRGSVPCKWDGGAGLMRGDERTWGLSEWVQEIRFTYLPLYSANRLEMVRGLTRHYTQMQPYLRAQTKQVWGGEGLWIPETTLPWGHAEDLLLEEGATDGFFLAWDPDNAPYGKFRRFNGYVGFLFTAGLEVCHHYLLYYRYSGDEEFLRAEAYPTLRGVCQFLAGLLRTENDGCYHLDPANALETWWLVRDPADTISGIQAIFPEFVRLAERYGSDRELRERCQDILAHLPPPVLAHWNRDGQVDPNARTYAPAGAPGRIREARNFEIPALYRVFPFGLSDMDSPDIELTRATFERRIYAITNSWSLDAVWAARLGLVEESERLLREHAARYNRFRYGGWSSSNSSVFPDGLSVVPYMDGAGLSAFALQQLLLQCQAGMIRVVPALPPTWSGIFRLAAENGVLVSADFMKGELRFVELHSARDGRCRIHNPWPLSIITDHEGAIVRETDLTTIELEMVATARYLLQPADRRVSIYPVEPIRDVCNEQPGLPGRDLNVGPQKKS
ncbi:MAG: DUF5703 domain-containing protein [Pirellulaceae bacterium]